MCLLKEIFRVNFKVDKRGPLKRKWRRFQEDLKNPKLGKRAIIGDLGYTKVYEDNKII